MTSASPTTHHVNGFQNHRALVLLPGLTGNFDVPGGNYVEPHTYIHNWSGAPTNEAKVRLVDRLKDLPPGWVRTASRSGVGITIPKASP